MNKISIDIATRFRHENTENQFDTFYTYLSEKAMAPHSSTLAWKITWTEEPGKLQSMG